MTAARGAFDYRVTAICCLVALFGACGHQQQTGDSGPEAGIFFRHLPIDFRLENNETPKRHVIETMAGGVAVFDFDSDGDLDIYFTNGAEVPSLEKTSPDHRNRLFSNDGRGGFTDVTDGSGLEGAGYDTGAAVADYDGDGDKDIFVGGVHRYTLYRNEGGGKFTDVTLKAGLSSNDPEFGPLWSVGGVWLDYNLDGELDLFVVNYLQWDPATERACTDYCHPRFYDPTPNSLYRGNGDGTFTDVSVESGIRDHPGKGMGAGFADFDGDGWLDIFVTNDKEFNFLFRQLPDHRFEEVAFDTGVVLPEHGNYVSGMGVSTADYDNDGCPDIAFVALDNETFPVFHNLGDGTFEELTVQTGLAVLAKDMAGYSPGFFDFDNDGWKDLFVSRGHVQSMDVEGVTRVKQHNTVFRNLRDGQFEALTEEAGFGQAPRRRHRGAAWGDFNGDGKIDIVVTALGEAAEIWINDSPGNNHWLQVDLQGSKSPRDAQGTIVKVTTADGDQYGVQSSTVGYASSSAGPVHFGLGANDSAQVVEIRWPSGTVQRLESVAADRRITIVEPGG